MPHVHADAAVPGKGPLSQRDIWAGQIVKDWFARAMGALSTVVGRNVLLETTTYALSTFMTVYPVTIFISEFRRGVLLLSIPLMLMFLGGLFGFAVARGWAQPPPPDQK